MIKLVPGTGFMFGVAISGAFPRKQVVFAVPGGIAGDYRAGKIKLVPGTNLMKMGVCGS
jgi:hypothetical protein